MAAPVITGAVACRMYELDKQTMDVMAR